MNQKSQFERVGLIARFGVRNIPTTLEALKDHLLNTGRTVVIEEKTAQMIETGDLPVIHCLELAKHCDVLIVVGGDGSLLHAAHIALKNNLPIFGINRGRLGFLTDIPPDQLEKVDAVLDGKYVLEERFLVGAQVHDDTEQIAELEALNDVVLLHADATHMIEFELTINNEFVCRQLADGLIIATPTGSTAYALSGGGPIMHPHLETLVMVPMFPHTLSNRPIVVQADADIDLRLTASNDNAAYISCDGMQRVDIPSEGRIHIFKKPEALQLIHPMDYSYYGTLRDKLGWQHYAERG
ncbi:MAG: NAD(+) kinase [Coxiellaceae bacterium]|nr:NAD(+) kinase [Coxiellaceae bacterium]